MARELSEFCESGLESFRHFEFEVSPAIALEGQDPTSERFRSYEAIMIAFRPKDSVNEHIESFVRAWADGCTKRKKKPMLICREGIFLPEHTPSRIGSWNQLVEDIEKEFDADVLWDKTPLFNILPDED